MRCSWCWACGQNASSSSRGPTTSSCLCPPWHCCWPRGTLRWQLLRQADGAGLPAGGHMELKCSCPGICCRPHDIWPWQLPCRARRGVSTGMAFTLRLSAHAAALVLSKCRCLPWCCCWPCGTAARAIKLRLAVAGRETELSHHLLHSFSAIKLAGVSHDTPNGHTALGAGSCLGDISAGMHGVLPQHPSGHATLSPAQVPAWTADQMLLLRVPFPLVTSHLV